MMRYLVIACFVALASSALADPVLVRIEEPPAWPLLARLDRPHADDASEAIERAAPPGGRHARRHYRHWRHR
jgi:hypothetical protein